MQSMVWWSASIQTSFHSSARPPGKISTWPDPSFRSQFSECSRHPMVTRPLGRSRILKPMASRGRFSVTPFRIARYVSRSTFCRNTVTFSSHACVTKPRRAGMGSKRSTSATGTTSPPSMCWGISALANRSIPSRKAITILGWRPSSRESSSHSYSPSSIISHQCTRF